MVMNRELQESNVVWKKLRSILFASALVFGVGATGVYVMSGRSVLLGADGMVTRQRIAVATPWHDARIREVYVRPGDKVEAGQKIAIVESTTILRSLADLSAEKARISSRMAELDARKAVVATLLPLAESSAKQAQAFLATIQKAGADGLAVNKSLHEMMAASVQASERFLSMQAEQTSIGVEIEANKKAMDQVSAAYDNLQHSYDNGILYAPVSGHIGSNVAMVGEVLSAGKDEIAGIYTGASFVLAYIPESYWFDVEDGQKVAVKVRGQTVAGYIESVLPVTEALPPEFQLPNRARGRGQLVRVALANNDDEIAVGQKALVTSCYVMACKFSLSAAVRGAMPGRREVSRKTGATAGREAAAQAINRPGYAGVLSKLGLRQLRDPGAS